MVGAMGLLALWLKYRRDSLIQSFVVGEFKSALKVI